MGKAKFLGYSKLAKLASAGEAGAAEALAARSADLRTGIVVRHPQLFSALRACGGLWKEIDDKRAARTLARDNRDQIARRKPGNVAERALRRAFARALSAAEFRQAKHSHKTRVHVEISGGRASSFLGSASPTSVGLPNAYAKKGYYVATSIHEFWISREFYDAPAASPGKLWLTPTLCVRQGRGAGLVLEILKGEAA